MKTIELALEPVTGYLVSITRNPAESGYEIEVGLPSSWYFAENDEIGCEVLSELSNGKIVRIFPKNRDIVIDDLIKFVEIIIDTNNKIAEKEKQFTDRMEEMKGVLEKEAKKFYEELDELKVNSINNLNDNFIKVLRPEGEKKERKPRKVNGLSNVSGGTETNTETIEIVKK
jgi:hypothetical protein